MAIYQAFMRQSAPNLKNLLATIIIMLVVIYFQVSYVFLTVF